MEIDYDDFSDWYQNWQKVYDPLSTVPILEAMHKYKNLQSQIKSNFHLEVKKGDLFKALNKTDIFSHSCNSRGVWGSGIAKIFHMRFPLAYQQYHTHLNKVGTGYVVEDNGYKIGCLITSKGYGSQVDSPDQIVQATYEAIKCLLLELSEKKYLTVTIHSPKINSGLFKTPWQKTKKAIKKACEESSLNVNWIVWEL